MNNSNSYESKPWSLLEKEGLADLSQFHRPGFFDEIPLYSRQADIAFLKGAAANDILLRFALKYVRAVISYEEHRTPYFAAITVWSFAEDDLLVPNLFVWSGPIKKMENSLTLSVVTTPFAKRIERIVSRLRLHDRFKILEDISTMPDTSRVFLGPAQPPYPTFVSLNRFCQRPSSAKR